MSQTASQTSPSLMSSRIILDRFIVANETIYVMADGMQVGRSALMVASGNSGLQRASRTSARPPSMLMKSLAQEVAPLRIRVKSIAPGAIRTPINSAASDTQEAYDALLKLIPCRRIGEPEEIGRAAVWLTSDQSDYVHGITLFIDGGMTLYPGFETGG